MNRIGIASALFFISAIAFAQDVPSHGEITGTALYRERIALPANAVFEATLIDVSKADAPADTISGVRVESPGNPPIEFSIPYDEVRIIPSHSYSVRATITDGDRLIFTSDRSYPVITRGNPKNVQILLRMVGPSSNSPSKAEAPKLFGTTWSLTELNGKPITSDNNHRVPELMLDENQHRVSGTSGCNRITGSYELDVKSLHFGPVASTRMACEPESMKLEQTFFQALETVRNWKIENNQLELTDADGKVIARFDPLKTS